jgi:hypothetical protein
LRPGLGIVTEVAHLRGFPLIQHAILRKRDLSALRANADLIKLNLGCYLYGSLVGRSASTLVAFSRSSRSRALLAAASSRSLMEAGMGFPAASARSSDLETGIGSSFSVLTPSADASEGAAALSLRDQVRMTSPLPATKASTSA